MTVKLLCAEGEMKEITATSCGQESRFFREFHNLISTDLAKKICESKKYKAESGANQRISGSIAINTVPNLHFYGHHARLYLYFTGLGIILIDGRAV